MNLRAPHLAALLAALAFTACGSHPHRERRPASGRPPVQGEARAVLTGRLLDQETHTGIPRAMVAVQPEDGAGPVLRGSTDADGGFRIEGLRAGVAYRAAAQAVVANRAYQVALSGRIVPEAGVDLAPLNLACAPAAEAGAIEGRAPRPGVVRLLQRAPLDGGGRLLVVLRYAAADDGAFRFDHVPAGEYVLGLGPTRRGEPPLRQHPRGPHRRLGPELVWPEFPVRVEAGRLTQAHWPEVKASAAAGD